MTDDLKDKNKRKAVEMHGFLLSAQVTRIFIITNFLNYIRNWPIDDAAILFYYFGVAPSGPQFYCNKTSANFYIRLPHVTAVNAII